MPIDLYPNIAKIKRGGAYQNLPGFVQQNSDADIEAMIANSESSTTAQYIHPAGSYFILNNVLYKAIINIAVNDTISVGTNCEIAILSNDVSNLKTALAEGGLTHEIKEALLQIASKVAYIDVNGRSYYNNLYNALYPEPLALYPFENGYHLFTSNNRTLTVTNGRHFVFTNPDPTLNINFQGGYINLSTVSENNSSGTSASNINKSTPLFKIPAGSTVDLTISNISLSNLSDRPSLTENQFAIGLRNSNTTVMPSGDKTITDIEDFTVTQTFETETPITCVFLYCRPSYSKVEADIRIVVNGEVWV